jgi:hypothetical protein
MATYLLIFILEMLVAFISWFILRKIFKNKFYSIAIIICIISLIVGYISTYRMIGYNVTLNYLTDINRIKISETGKGITPEEENNYKKNLFSDEKFKNTLFSHSLKIMSVPSILLIIIIFSIAIKSKKKHLKSS